MAVQLAGYAAIPQSVQTVTIDGQKWRLTLTARPRLRAWYADLHTQEGVAVFQGRRVSPGWGPILGLLPAGAPAGVLYVRGADGYALDELGATLTLRHYTDAEIESARVVADPGYVVEV